MKLITLLAAGILISAPAIAQPSSPISAPPSALAASSSSELDAQVTGDLPVSLDRIRDGLERPAATRLFTVDFLKRLDDQPDFRINIEESRRIEELLATLNFKAGPTPAGGLYAFEQQRMMFPAVDNPLAQPYAAFNQGELLTVAVENLAGKYLATRVVDSITKAVREHAEAAARQEVDSSVAEYCAGQPNNGAAIDLCASQPQPGELPR